MWRAPWEEAHRPNGQQQSFGLTVLSFASSSTVRRWPFVAILLSVVLLGSTPWLYSQLMPKSLDFQLPTSAPSLTIEDTIYNPNAVGQDYKYEQAAAILNCTNQPWRPKLPRPFTQERTCPTYFQLIQKDLSPWKEKGITRANVETARIEAFAKFSIIDGKLYIERFRDCYATRSIFSTWGLLLFLEKYKGQVPDVEFMMHCEDRPAFSKYNVGPSGPPITLSYDSRSDFFDIAFPDWSFWGWSELSIRSWDEQREMVMNGSKRQEWSAKIPKAYWSGNPSVAPSRQELTRCNHVGKIDIHLQDWRIELSSGNYKSNLADQCTHKYLIYAEGISWSVGFKYMLACGSPVLALSPAFHEFFSRGLQEMVSYVPVRPRALRHPELCYSIDQAVSEGEKHQTQALEIGKAAQDFMNTNVSMEMVYNYMFHLLLEYSKLQTFTPGISNDSHLLTLDHFQCLLPPHETSFLHNAMEALPMNSMPCTMPEVPEGQDAFQGYGFEVIQPYKYRKNRLQEARSKQGPQS